MGDAERLADDGGLSQPDQAGTPERCDRAPVLQGNRGQSGSTQGNEMGEGGQREI